MAAKRRGADIGFVIRFSSRSRSIGKYEPRQSSGGRARRFHPARRQNAVSSAASHLAVSAHRRR